MARSLPKALTITDAAADRVKALMSKANDEVVGLRIGVKARGCSGLSYDVQYAKEKLKFDEVVEDKGVTVLIDPAAVMFLIGSEMTMSTTSSRPASSLRIRTRRAAAAAARASTFDWP